MNLHEINIQIGQRIRRGRIKKKLSQEKLGEPLNVTFQQIQKYENGSNRVSCASLVVIAKTLDLPVAWFFEEIESNG